MITHEDALILYLQLSVFIGCKLIFCLPLKPNGIPTPRRAYQLLGGNDVSAGDNDEPWPALLSFPVPAPLG
jgi:hypothetical protein